MPRCAVVGCETRGRRHVCPFDNRYHWHGRIHYTEERSALKFHDDAWDYICDGHFQQVSRENTEFEFVRHAREGLKPKG